MCFSFRLVGILQGRGLVEDGFLRGGVLVLHVVAGALELDGDAGGVLQEGGLGVTAADHQGFRIQEVLVVLVLGNLGHVGEGEEAVVVADLEFLRVRNGNPVDRPLDGAPFAGYRMRGRIVGALQLNDLAISIFDYLIALDDIGVLEADLTVRLEAEELLGSVFHEVGPVDVEFTGERDAAGGTLRLGRVQRAVEPFDLAFRIVGEGDLDRILHHHVAVGTGVQVLADAPFEKLDVHQLVALGNADLLAEHPERLGRVAAAAHAAQGRHPGIVPAGDQALLHQFEKFPLTHQGIGEVQAGELILVGGIDTQRLDEPVIERTVDVELQRADGVGDMLDGIALAVGVVVHRVDAPLVAGAVMVRELDAVQQRVAEHHVGMGHVDLRAEDLLPFRVLAGLHLAEEPEVLLRGAVAPGARGAGLVHGAAVQADLLLRLVIDIGESPFDQVLGPLVELVEIIGGIEFLVPMESQPLDVFLDGIHVLGVLLGGVRVVVTEIRDTAVLLREAEVEADGLGMSQMQIAVRLRRETGDDGVHLAAGEVRFDDFFEEIQFAFFHGHKLNHISDMKS